MGGSGQMKVVSVLRGADSSIVAVGCVVSKSLQKAGAVSHALVLRDDGDVAKIADHFNKVDSFGLQPKCWKGLRLKLFIRLKKYFSNHKVDAVVVHQYKEFVMMLLLQRLFAFKLVLIFHGERDLRSVTRRWWLSHLINKDCYLVGVSQSVGNYISTHLNKMPENDIVVVNNGVDFKDLERNFLARDDARQALNLHSQGIIFGTMGRLAHTKGIDVLIMAFSSIAKKDSSIQLAIMGEGGKRRELAALVTQLGVQEQVTFLGKIEKGAYYLKAFDYFVFPSRREGFGLALIEAIAAKLPVIFSDIAVFQSLVARQELMALVGDEKSLQLKMETVLLTSENHHEISAEQYCYARDNFSIEHMVQAYKEFFLKSLELG
ncbi:MAG: glycosyltransferase involved in cell wall biosynthesis [Pseudohongiellaceae bacterium]|jgi:glycosyltransferase involved in cell wall biosynthesis